MFFSECCFGSDRSHNGHVANVAVTQMTHLGSGVCIAAVEGDCVED